MATLEEFKAMSDAVPMSVQGELFKLMTSDPDASIHGGVALACVRCANGYSVLTLSHLRAEPMSKEQLDAVKDQLLSEDNADLRQNVLTAYLKEPERGANMIIAFAADKGLKLDATSDEVVDYLEKLEDDDVDIEMTPEMLASVSGGGKLRPKGNTRRTYGK